ncbi:MAG: hypothetical protein V3T42_08820 [Nitrospirales bacterium]
MSESPTVSPFWDLARTYLVAEFSGWLDASPTTDALTLPLADEDWLLEVTQDGHLVCVAGYDLDDMKSLLSEGTPEDLGTDELAKQAKFYLQQTIAKHRHKLLAEGFTERIEMNDSYVAAHFERAIDLEALSKLRTQIQTCQTWFKAPK